jgi:type II secretory pathway pseudopilin PulG
MKSPDYLPYPNKGLTLIEMTIVLLILMTLLGTGIMVFRGVDEWKLGRTASETLRTVHSAQRMFLSDHPTRLVSSLTPADILPYMTGSPLSMPTVKSLTGTDLSINVDVSPPVIDDGAGNTYDPSDNPTDSLWDVGE